MMATANNLTEDDDEIKIQTTRDETSPTLSFFQVMNSYGREFIFVLALIFTAIAALQNGPLKSRKTNPPELFFSPPSLVTDFFQGNFNSLSALISEKDVSLVMYYAPWDSLSMITKDEFETAAKFYHREVFFAAVNCWWPEGDCSRKFKIQSFPVIFAHVHDVGGIRYEGPLISNYIIAFLDYVLTPLTTLQHTGELLDLLTEHEGVLVAFFDFKGTIQPNGYSQYYSASLVALTTDPNRRLCFAIITNRKVAQKFKLENAIQIYLWNSTEVYPGQSYVASDVLKWAYSKLDQVTQWVTPPGSKSKILSGIIEKSATLIMFTPRNLMLESSPYFDLFREVALDYNNCNTSSQVTALVHRTVLKRHILQEELTKLIERCKLDGTANVCQQNEDSCDLSCCKSVPLNLGFRQDSQCLCHVCLHHAIDSTLKMKLSECENTLELVLKGLEVSELKTHDHCNQVETSYPIKFGAYNRLSFKCHNEPSKMHLKTGFKDDISPEAALELKDDHVLMMARNFGKIQCNRLKFALNYSELNFPEFPLSGNNSWQANFTGLGCRTNRSLLFIAMDSIQFHTFAESLGINLLKKHHRTTAIIVEAKHESQYVLKGHINKKSLVEFIKNYTLGTLDRFLRSTIRNLDSCKDRRGNICIQELTTATFVDHVLDNKNDVILMYYATWCGACSAVSHAFLSVANYFSDIDQIKFARISGDDNDLPWEYTVEKYPSIIFFPADRKTESVEFPPNLPITTTNLLHFILVNSQPKVRWVIAMQMCNRDCVAHNLASSSSEIRRLFRELHVVRNQLRFVQHVIYENTKSDEINSLHEKPLKSLFSPDSKFLKEEGRSAYVEHLLGRIRTKQSKIEQALHLQMILRKKRDFYLDDRLSSTDRQKTRDTSDRFVNKKYNSGKFSKVPSKKSESAANSLNSRTNRDEL